MPNKSLEAATQVESPPLFTVDDFPYSLSNPKILDYLRGTSEEVPIDLYRYVIDHPLTTPNFVKELTEMVRQAQDVVLRRNIKGGLIKRFEGAAVDLGRALGDGKNSVSNALIALAAMKLLFQLSESILKHK